MRFETGFSPESEQQFVYESVEQRGGIEARFKRTFTESVEGLPPDNGREARLEVKITSGEEEVSVDNLLPPEWKIVESQTLRDFGSEIAADHESKTVRVPRFVLINDAWKYLVGENSAVGTAETIDGARHEIHEFWKVKGSFLVLLHEIGHAWNGESSSLSDRSREYAEKYNVDALLAVYIKDFRKLPDSSIPAYGEMILQEERDAWSYALRVYLELKKDGVEIEDLSHNEVLRLVNGALAAYGNEDPRLKDFKRKFISEEAKASGS